MRNATYSSQKWIDIHMKWTEKEREEKMKKTNEKCNEGYGQDEGRVRRIQGGKGRENYMGRG